MAYATVQQAVDLHGESAIAVTCDRDLDGTADLTSFTKWLRVATNEMDSALLGKVKLPLVSPPEIFQMLCVDIARYHAASVGADSMTELITKRYERATAIMSEYAMGKRKVESAPAVTEANLNQTASTETVAERSMSLVWLDSGAREFTTDSLKRII